MTLKKISSAALATGAICFAFSANAATAAEAQKAPTSHGNGTELVILGSAAGRTSWGGHSAGGMSAAIAVGSDRYIVDFGRGWHERYYEAGLGTPAAPTGFGGLENLRAGFITHLHADHVIDYPRLLLFGATEGLRKRKAPIQIFGPGNRGGLPPTSGKLTDSVDTINPENPTPGTAELTEYLYRAFATDLNDNIHDSGMPNPNAYIKVHDIQIPPAIGASKTNTSPRMAPINVYQDENVKVTATLVSHPPMYPSFAFRFDTSDGSVVFSGDTNRSENLIELAKGADVLVHEVISTHWAENLFPKPRTAAQEAKLDHLIKSHTPISEVGPIAHEAGVKLLVLSHLAPPTIPDEEWLKAVKTFAGRTAIGNPLFRVKLPLRGADTSQSSEK